MTVTTLDVGGLLALPDHPWTSVDVAALSGEPTEALETRYVLHRLLELGSRLLLAGDEGGGKSLLTAQLAVRLAAGMSCLPGDDPPGPFRVLVVDTELNERTARRRLAPMAAHAGLQPGQLVYVLAPAGIDLLRHEEADAFAAIVTAFQPHLVVIDSLYRAFSGDPDDPRVGGDVQRVLDTIRASVGCALMIVCHYRKRSTDGRKRRSLDDLAGSRVWKAWPETAVDITDKSLRILKDREGTAAELTLTRTPAGDWEDDPAGWPFTITTGDETTVPTWQGHTLIQSYALGVLARGDEALATSRVASLISEQRLTEGHRSGFHRDNVTAALGELETAGRVRWEPGPRNAKNWRITAAGLDHISNDQPETSW